MSSDTTYDLAKHPAVEIDSLPSPASERLTATLHEVAGNEQPTSHPQCKKLTDTHAGYLSVRSGQLRAICQLSKPHLLVLCAGKRDTVYDQFGVVERRCPDA